MSIRTFFGKEVFQVAILKEKNYTLDDIYKLPDFIRVTLFDGEILTNDWTNLIIDEEVFKNLPSEDHHKTYRLSIVKSE